MTDVLVMIPCRGGSRGIPKKNLHPLAGKPLMSWSIEQALAAEVGPVVVVTDDADIAKVAAHCGVTVQEEPKELAGDTISMESVMRWFLDTSFQLYGKHPDWLMVLQPTSPLRLSPMIREAWAIAKTGAFNSVFSVVPSAHCCWRSKDRDFVPEWPQRGILKRMTRQEAGQQWTENGAIYAVKSERFLVEETRFCPPMYLYEMPGWTTWEVDESEDLAWVEIMMRARFNFGADGVRT